VPVPVRAALSLLPLAVAIASLASGHHSSSVLHGHGAPTSGTECAGCRTRPAHPDRSAPTLPPYRSLFANVPSRVALVVSTTRTSTSSQ
jgi:hypothetical protein